VDYTKEFRGGARRYDVGQTADFAKIPAIKAALHQTLGWGVAEIGTYAAHLNDLIARRGEALGLTVAPAALRAPHLLGMHLKDADPEAVAQTLEAAKVYVSVRGRSLRVSPHVYNTEIDVDRLIEALRAAL
jgi:selenocysteine lyase/cysteine desulfurase